MKTLHLQVDVENNQTTIMSDYSAWENIALLLEGVAMSMQKCIEEGMPKEDVYKGTTDYFMKAVGEYKIIK